MAVRAFISFKIIDCTESAFEAAIELTDKDNTVWIVPLGGPNAQLAILEATKT